MQLIEANYHLLTEKIRKLVLGSAIALYEQIIYRLSIKHIRLRN